MKTYRLGLIPAHAGKTEVIVERVTAPRAHPRSRGENLIPRTTRVIAAGSSPLTRGKHEKSALVPVVPGLIPAHAGKTDGRNRRVLH